MDLRVARIDLHVARIRYANALNAFRKLQPRPATTPIFYRDQNMRKQA